MKRDVNHEDIAILSSLGYNAAEIKDILDHDKAYTHTSFPEQYIYEVMKHNYNKVENRMKMSNGMELDIAIFDINTGIEYSSAYFHSKENGLERDKRKKEFIESHGVRLITIIEHRISKQLDEKVIQVDNNTLEIYLTGRTKYIFNIISKLSSILGKNLVIPDDIEYKAKTNMYKTLGKQCLAYRYPEIAKQYSKNNKISSKNIFPSDHSTVEWYCNKCNMYWYTSVANRVRTGSGCPYCEGKKAIPYKTDIITLLPGYASEITSLTENELRNTLPTSVKVVEWKCTQCGHKWTRRIRGRTQFKSGCPICGYIPMQYTDNWHNIKEVYTNAKKIKSAIIFGKNIEKPNYMKIFRESLVYLLNKHINRLNEIVDNKAITSTKGIYYLSKSNINFRKPRYIELPNSTKVYYETHCALECTLRSLIIILEVLDENINEIRVQLDTEILNNQRVKNITKSKNGDRWNVAYYIQINDKEKIKLYIGSRETFNEAVLLKLSSEIYYFGAPKDKNIHYEGEIPRFEDLPEYTKLKEAGRIRKQY